MSDERNLADVLCDHACHFHPEYGFVPEAGCPVHDVPDGYIPLGDPRMTGAELDGDAA